MFFLFSCALCRLGGFSVLGSVRRGIGARCIFATNGDSGRLRRRVLQKADRWRSGGSGRLDRFGGFPALAGASPPRRLLQGAGGWLKRGGSTGHPGSSLRDGRDDGAGSGAAVERAVGTERYGHDAVCGARRIRRAGDAVGASGLWRVLRCRGSPYAAMAGGTSGSLLAGEAPARADLWQELRRQGGSHGAKTDAGDTAVG